LPSAAAVVTEAEGDFMAVEEGSTEAEEDFMEAEEDFMEAEEGSAVA